MDVVAAAPGGAGVIESESPSRTSEPANAGRVSHQIRARRDGLIAWGLFFAFVLIYFGTAKGILEEVDDFAMLRVTEAIVRAGSFAVPADTPGASVGVDGRSYTRYGVGQSLLGIPFFLIGERLPQEVATRDVYDPHGFVLATPLAFVMTGLGAVCTAACVALLFVSGRMLGYSALASLLAAAGLGLGTFAWFYARTFMSEAPSMLFALLGLFGVARYAIGGGGTRWLWMAGVAGGVLVLLRVGNAVLLPPLGLWLLWSMRTRPRAAIGASIAWGAPIVVALVLMGIYNAARFGSPLQTGYGDAAEAFTTPVPVGLYGLLFSAGKSVFLYAPLTLAGLVGWFTLRQAYTGLAWALAGMLGLYLLFYSHYDWWYGGGPWGPRFLAVVLPLFGIGLGALLNRCLPRAAVLALAALGVVSVGIQALSILAPYLPYDAVMEQDPVTFDRMLWHPAYSPLVGALRDLVRRAYPIDIAFSYFDVPWLGVAQVLAFVAGLAVLVACARHCADVSLNYRTRG